MTNKTLRKTTWLYRGCDCVCIYNTQRLHREMQKPRHCQSKKTKPKKKTNKKQQRQGRDVKVSARAPDRRQRKAGEAACGKSHPPAPKYTIKKQVRYVGKRLRRTARAGQLRQLEGTAPSFTSLVPSVKTVVVKPAGLCLWLLEKPPRFDRNLKLKKTKACQLP